MNLLKARHAMGFKGGYRFKNFEGAATAELRECPLPGEAFISANVGDTAFRPLVNASDPVRAGQEILESGGNAPVRLCASVNGTVKDVTDAGVTLNSDGTTVWQALDGHTRSPWHLDHAELFGLFRSSGCALLIDGAPKTADDCMRVGHIIVNAVFNAPLNQAWNPSMAGDPYLVPGGLKTLKALFPNADITIAVNKRNAAYARSADIAETTSHRIVGDKYPHDNPELLARDITGKPLTNETGSRDNTTLVVPIFDILTIAEVMTQGKPLIERIVLIAGPGVSRPGWYRVRIGTPLADIKRSLMKSDDRGPWRIISGGLFDGRAVEPQDVAMGLHDTEITVIREGAERELYRFVRPGFFWDSYSITTVADIVPFLKKKADANLHGGERPCVQCNYCDEVCPAGIYPFLIWKYVCADKTEESFRLRPQDCMGCGLCDYVCPSKIPVSAVVMKAKEAYYKSRRPDESAD